MKTKKRVLGKKTDSQKEVPVKRGNETMERAQVWSIDVLLAVVIFIAIIIIFYTTINYQKTPGLDTIKTDPEKIRVELERNPELAFLKESEISYDKLQNFTNEVATNYSGVKQKLGIQGDFCIFYEDENGNIIRLKDNKTGVGNPGVIVGGVPCGTAP
jgi:hypothetical protein